MSDARSPRRVAFPAERWLGCTLFLAACGGPQGPAGPTSVETLSGQAAAGGFEIDPGELATALTRLCHVAREEIVDRSRPSASRLRRVEARFDRTPHEGLLDDFFHLVEAHAELRGEQRFPPFESVQAVAAEVGVPGYQCPEFARLLALVRTGDADLDLAQAPTPLQDLGRLCDVAVEAEGWGPSTEPFGARFARRISDELANPDVRNTVETLNESPPTDRYSLLRSAAGDMGMPGWACPPLERAFLRVGDEEGARAEAP